MWGSLIDKNALDYVYREGNDKAAGIISYGAWVSGARAAEALRLVLAELQVATVRTQPTISTHPSFRTGAFVPRRASTPLSAACSTR
ncbi:NADPH-dependent FMN reductase [Streptomyces sp. NBC_00696]|uniref:NADPH-dependent FMN reductase n=1 Tax=Streptomyces sp. NBC_00696 TaxID=2903672 RepID=UPI002E3408AA|nr:NAD(P)H-dependent oxidoreductase [Streptomyces sp. NBC_00696]